MGWKLDKNRPICPQICEQISVRIASGEFKANERLMSVRELAVEAGVNPNTVQKAFEQLEAKKLIYSVRGCGWFVDTVGSAKETVERLMFDKTAAYVEEMALLGLNLEQVKKYIKEWNE